MAATSENNDTIMIKVLNEISESRGQQDMKGGTREKATSTLDDPDRTELDDSESSWSRQGKDETSIVVGANPRQTEERFNSYKDEESLAVAIAVHDTDHDVTYCPHAVELDPDFKSKGLERYNTVARVRWLFAALLTMAGVIVISAIIVPLTRPDTIGPPALDDAMMQLRLEIERMVGPEALAELKSPFQLAWEWLSQQDPARKEPDPHATSTQRFLAASLYFATSVQQPWAWCAPVSGSDKDPTTTSNQCTYVRSNRVYEGDEDEGYKIDGFRWLSRFSECSWVGVSCTSKGHIAKINLAGMKMTGRFPEAVQYLATLEFLNFGNGALNGPIPSFLGQMSLLTHVELQQNQLSGTIPKQWWDNARNLTYLDLSSNELNGTIATEIGRLSQLAVLFLHDNHLSGSIPDVAPSTTDILMHGNKLHGSIPTSIGGLSLLRQLRLDRNQLSGGIPTELGRAVGLADLHLGSNPLGGELPNELYDLTNLLVFDVSVSNLTGTISRKIGRWSALTHLILNDNRFTGRVPSETNLEHLESLSLDRNAWSGPQPVQVCELVQSLGVAFDCLADGTLSPCC